MDRWNSPLSGEFDIGGGCPGLVGRVAQFPSLSVRNLPGACTGMSFAASQRSRFLGFVPDAFGTDRAVGVAGRLFYLFAD